jgi:hypothetical protein
MAVSSKKRILPANLPAYFIPIEVTKDWTTPLNAGIDINAATGFPIIGEPIGIIYDLYFSLWDGYDDSDNYAMLHFDASVPDFAYEDIMAGATPFTTAPTVGNVVYLFMTRVKK